MPDVFVSYSHGDRDAAAELCEILQENGIQHWSDAQIMGGTSSWTALIEDRIEQATHVVAILSPSAKASVWVRREVAMAQVCAKTVVPIMIDGDYATSVPLHLIEYHIIDARDGVRSATSQLLACLGE